MFAEMVGYTALLQADARTLDSAACRLTVGEALDLAGIPATAPVDIRA